MRKVTVGIDIGGTNTAIGIVDQNGNVLVKGAIPTPSHGDIDAYIDELALAINSQIEVCNNKDRIEVLGIGIGAPNANYYRGTIEQAANLSFQGTIPFVDLLKEKFPHVKVIALTNDANAAAMGEMIYGGAIGMKNFIMYTLGTGVGSGIVVNGELVYGHDGFAGECGHTVLVPDGRLCGCGANGHLEAYCSATGMKRTVFELLAKYNAVDSSLADIPFNVLESKDIYDAAMAGDAIANKVFEITGKYLGVGLADSVHHTSPEAIFLFGGPVASGELLFKPTIASFEESLLSIYRGRIKVLPSKLQSGDAAIVGASALVWKELSK